MTTTTLEQSAADSQRYRLARYGLEIIPAMASRGADLIQCADAVAARMGWAFLTADELALVAAVRNYVNGEAQ